MDWSADEAFTAQKELVWLVVSVEEGIVAKVVAMAQGGVWNGLDNAAYELRA